MFVAFLIILSPLAVEAGVVSAIIGFFSNDKKSTQISSNSQNMAVLAAALTPILSVGGPEISTVDDSALLSESGPEGIAGNSFEYSQSSDQINLYVVRDGDTLSQIAEMFGVSVNTIRWTNDISGSILQKGKTLVILPISGVKHTVVKGDTLKSITKKYGGDLDEILRYNDLSVDSSLAIGEVIIVPDGEISSPSPSSSYTYSSGSNLKDASGYYIRPVNGRRSQGIHGYNAVDIAAPAGTPIVAAAAGEVIISKGYGWNGGYGSYIVIRHNNGTQTLYAHNSRNIVSGGSYVGQGEIIGYVGSTGKATGYHTHFEIRGARNPF